MSHYRYFTYAVQDGNVVLIAKANSYTKATELLRGINTNGSN